MLFGGFSLFRRLRPFSVTLNLKRAGTCPHAAAPARCCAALQRRAAAAQPLSLQLDSLTQTNSGCLPLPAFLLSPLMELKAPREPSAQMSSLCLTI